MCDKKNSNDLKRPFEDDRYKSDHHMVNQMSALSSNCHSSRLGSTSGNSDNSGGGNFRLPGVSSSSSSSNNNNNSSGSIPTHSTSNCAISTPPPPGHTLSHLLNAFVNAFSVQSTLTSPSELDMIYHAVTSQHNPKSNFSLFGSQIPVSNSYRTIPSNASQIIPSSQQQQQQQQQLYASKQSSMPHQPSASRRTKNRREANIPRNSQPPKPGLQGPSVSSNAQYPYAFDASLPRNPSHITSGPSFSFAHSMQSQESANTSGSDVPLNLSVKKTSTGESSRDNRSLEKYHKVKGDLSNTGVGEKSGSLYSHSSKRDTQGNLSPSSEDSTLERPRKRGRKPKSLLASQSEAMSSVIMVPELSEMKPKRRGRPPILSPPPSMSPSDKDTQHLNDRIASEMRRIERAQISAAQSWSQLSRNLSSSGSKNLGNMYTDGRIVDNLKSPASFSGESSNNGVIAENSDSDGRNISDDRLRSSISSEEDLRKPLEFGWRRHTLIKGFTRSGVEGEVMYFSPCGRKMRCFSEINKFLSKNKSFLKRENFSFDSKLILGEFLQNNGTDLSVMSEQEVRSRLEEISRHGLKRPRTESNRGLNDSDRSARDVRHDLSDSVGMRNDSYIARTPEDRYARITAEEFIAAREDMIRKYQECKENKRYTGEILKDADPFKQKNYQMIAEVDRERRKQHMGLIRAMDAHRRYEEREKERERVNMERKLITERRYRKKKLELEIARELRRPVEDMILRRSTPLPILKRVPGLKLPSKVFAQLLMVHEFLHNFGETLGFDMDSLPSLNTLQKALLNLETEAEDDIISTLHHLLVCAIDDPGTPCHVTTVMGQKLRDAQISNFNLSEILKVYFQSFANQYLDESPEENHPVINIYNALKTGRPFLSLPASLKMEILAFLCNELSSNQAIVHQIEDTIESLVQLRKERWHLGCELRKYKAIKLRREKSSEEAGEELKKFDKNEIDRGLLEDSAESDVDDNIIITVHETEEDAEITNEELDKKLNKLAKECSQINHKLNKAIQCLRISPLGLDRYRRRFWFLPAAGCIFIEGIESGQPEEIANNKSGDSSSDEKEEEDDDEDEKDENSEKSSSEQNDETEKRLRGSTSGKDEISIEPVSHERDKKPSKEVTVTIQPVVDRKDLAPAKKEEIKCEMEIEINPAKSIPPLKDSWTSSSIKNSDSLNGCASSDADNECLNTNGSLPLGDSDIIDSKPETKKQWFSMLPRVPCHDSTILMPEKKPSSSPSPSSVNDKENSKSEVDATESKKPDSQAEGVQPNAIVNAFLYPHLLESFFQQIRPTNGKCSNSDSTSAKSLPSKETTSFPDEADQSQPKSLPQTETEPEQPPVVLNSMSRLEAEIALFQSALDSSGMEIDPELKKKLFQHRKMQYRRPKKIPEQFQRGWWRITSLDDVVVLVSTLNERGIRERHLFKHLNKYVHYVSGRSRSKVAEFDHNSDDECLSPPSEESETPDEWNKDLALRLDISVLEQIEALEEKIASSSMQIRGWRPLPKITTDNSIRFEVSKSYFSNSKEEKDDDKESESVPAPSTTSSGRLSKSEANKKVVDPLKIGRERILTAEAMTERRYLKPPLGFKANTIILPSSNSGNGSDEYADNAADENAPSGLLRWREAVRECESGSQLALLLHFLESCIAWDKSIMRASCQFCSSGENEAQLLLCDGCDKGYHMYCFKPKMESVPEGDWFCFECQNKNTIDKVCIVCGKKGKLINCDTCPKVYHPNCLDPPVTKPPKGRWCCNMCNRRPKKKISKKGGANQNQSSAEETNTASSSASKDPEKRAAPKSRQKKQQEPPPPPPPPPAEETPVKETKKDKKVKENKDNKDKDNNNKDVSVCSALLSEIEKHDDSWPFLFPVNTKQFPTYKKIIKKPMDFATIKSRLEADNYKNKAEFIQDCRLIFDNCETFNEDESPVGQAGHNLRRFMDKRWKELGGEKPDKS